MAALARETATARVQMWLSQQDPGKVVISDWVVTEFAFALSIKVRAGALSVADRARLAAVFDRLRTESLVQLAVAHDHFVTAGQFAERFNLGLRAADALHVAIAAAHGATLCTLDRRLAAAASTLGVSTTLV